MNVTISGKSGRYQVYDERGTLVASIESRGHYWLAADMGMQTISHRFATLRDAKMHVTRHFATMVAR
jgi:hypothetical protein